MLKRLTLLLTCLLLAVGLGTAQMVTVPSPVTGLVGNYFRTAGGTTAFSYWVIAVGPFGHSPMAGPFTFAASQPATLNANDYNYVAWNPYPGATGYTVLRNTTGTTPSGACNCAAMINNSRSSYTDYGTALLTYTVDLPQTQELTALPANDATTTGITLDVARLINGILAHAPTGAVNDTTDTATNIVAALPNCVIGTSFNFWLRNNSGGANTITLVGGTSVTVVGTATVAQNNVKWFRGTVTNCATPAVSMTSLGTSVF